MNESTKYHGRTVAPEDIADHHAGLALIENMGIPRIRSGPEAGRYRTTWGTKRPAGLTRSLVAMLENRLKQPANS